MKSPIAMNAIKFNPGIRNPVLSNLFTSEFDHLSSEFDASGQMFSMEID
jgi:hypothetical protein